MFVIHRTVAGEWIPGVHGQPLASLNSAVEVMGKGVLIGVFSFPVPHFFHQLPAYKQTHVPKVMDSTDPIHSEVPDLSTPPLD